MSTPPGWYDDGSGTTRWWDGQRWTDGPPAGTDAPSDPSGEVTTVRPAQQPTQQPTQQPSAGQGAPYGQQGGYAGSSGQPYGAAPGGYAAPTPYGSPAAGSASGGGKKGKGLKIALVVVLVLVLVGGGGAAYWLLRGDDGGEEATDDPEVAAVTDAVEAVFAVTSCEDEVPLVTGERLAVVEELVDLGDVGACATLPDTTFEVETRDVEVDGDTATAVAEVTGTYDGDVEGVVDPERVIGLDLEQVDGEWLVAKRTVTGTTPAQAVQAYLEAGSCAERAEVATEDLVDALAEAQEADDWRCREASLRTVVADDLEGGTEEDGDEATVTTALEVSFGGDGGYDDDLTASLARGDLGWSVTALTSQAQQAANVGIEWYTAPSCEAEIALSVDPILTDLQQSLASPESFCQHLDDYVYEAAENVLPTASGDSATVVFDIRGTYTGDAGLGNIGEEVTLTMERVDDQWFVADASGAVIGG